MSYLQEVKEIAYRLDPDCWKSYSGEPRVRKREMDRRRTAALETAQRRYDAEQRLVRDEERSELRGTLDDIMSAAEHPAMRRLVGVVETILDRVEALEK